MKFIWILKYSLWPNMKVKQKNFLISTYTAKSQWSMLANKLTYRAMEQMEGIEIGGHVCGLQQNGRTCIMEKWVSSKTSVGNWKLAFRKIKLDLGLTVYSKTNKLRLEENQAPEHFMIQLDCNHFTLSICTLYVMPHVHKHTQFLICQLCFNKAK